MGNGRIESFDGSVHKGLRARPTGRPGQDASPTRRSASRPQHREATLISEERDPASVFPAATESRPGSDSSNASLSHSRGRRVADTSLGATLLIALSIGLTACGGETTAPIGRPEYVGASMCSECHEDQHTAWSGSHHDLAMQEVTEGTVLGDFDDATFDWHGVTSTFSRDRDRFVVETEGDDGALHEYEVAYVFGVTPLQQYLVAFPGGRFQVLPLCWDSRPAENGGQRWFHIYQDNHIPPGHELFWTGRAQNWQVMCAECHSTGLRKNHDVATDSYETTWSEIDVSCETCHGPGGDHVTWVEARAVQEIDSLDVDPDDPMGLVVLLRRGRVPPLEVDPETGLAKRERQPADVAEIETCARCHSRRSQMRKEFVHGGPLLDTHRVALLEQSLYFPDGQIDDEVYVYGSFVQSRMYAAGVGCTDCHYAHSLSLRAVGNALCTRCHLNTTYDTPEHHHHEQGTEGAACVECHMPERTYMVVDPRRDHSMRVPRPDLTRKTGSPNACNGCHADKSVAWTEERATTWYGVERARTEHYGEILHAARTRAPGYESRLVRLAADDAQPAIVRATAIDMLSDSTAPAAQQVIESSLRDREPLVRGVAANALGGQRLSARPPAVPLLRDPVRGVRVAAAMTLVPLMGSMSGDEAAAMEAAFAELVSFHRATGDRPEAHVSLGAVHAQAGNYTEAERAYRTALRIAPEFGSAYVNFAEFYRTQSRDDDGEALLARAVADLPDDAALHHALGLVRVRLGHLVAAVPALARAAELAPGVARYAHVYGVALEATGDARGAIAVLSAAHERHPREPAILLDLATIHRDAGEAETALRYAAELVELRPDDPQARRLLEQLQQR